MPAETVNVSGISGRYATALFDLAKEQGQLDAVAADLAGLQGLFDESADLVRLVRSPMFSREDQTAAIGAVLEKAGTGQLVRNFVSVVGQNRRLFALPGMIADFNRLLAAHRGEVVADVVSAHPLSDSQLAAVKAAASQAIGREVTLAASVDDSLIGGLIVKVGSRMVDASLRTKLQSLKFAMKGVG